jgi:hypothetical protein
MAEALAANSTASQHRPAASDDEILGLDSKYSEGKANGAPRRTNAGEPGAAPETTDSRAEAASHATGDEPAALQQIFEANPELRRVWRAEREYREVFPSVEKAREAGAQLADLAHMDALFFSGRPESHAELAAAVCRLDPQQFRGLAQAMAAALAQMGPESGAPQGREAGMFRPAQTASGTQNDAAVQGPGAGQFAAFYQEANAAAVQNVLQAIEGQVDRLLPEGIAAGARNRVIGEVYRELDAALRGNRALTHQTRQAFRNGGFDAEHQRAVVGLLVGRARQALPGVAKKVVGEWTSGVLAASGAKRARQRTAESRVDISGGGAGDSAGRRYLSPRDIDYAKLSDGDILNL